MTICGPNQNLASADVAQLMRNAGFPESAIQTGLAVSYGESGWESGNCNLNDPNGGSFGLWQINGIHFLSGGMTKACAFDPQCATNYAYSLWKSQGWNPWGAYTDGRYLQFMGGGTPATTAPVGIPLPGFPNVTPGEAVQLQGTDPISQFLNNLPNPLQGVETIWSWISNPVRVIKMIVGVGLVVVSVLVLFLPEAEKTVTSAAATVAKVRHPVKAMKAAASRGTKKAGIRTGKAQPSKPAPKPAPKPAKIAAKTPSQARSINAQKKAS